MSIDHVLLPQAKKLAEVEVQFKSILTNDIIRNIVSLIPDDWLQDETYFSSAAEHREMYIQFLETRLAHSNIFVKHAQDAAAAII